MSTLHRKTIRQRIHKRIRRKVSGTTERPRLAVHYSNQHIYAQVIDDSVGRTLVSASTMDKAFENASSNVECAKKVGQLLAERAKGSNNQGPSRRSARRRTPILTPTHDSQHGYSI
jgi:large subunit ribosomal protein L18